MTEIKIQNSDRRKKLDKKYVHEKELEMQSLCPKCTAMQNTEGWQN